MTNKLPEKLNALRKYFSFAQLDVASKIGVPVSEYMKWENGNTVCGIEELKRIARLYEVPVQDLFVNDREVKMPELDMPYASVEIPFVESTSQDGDDYMEESDYEDHLPAQDTIEMTKEVESEEDLGKTRTLNTGELQATTMMRIQDASVKKKTKNINVKKANPKMNPKLLAGIGAGVLVVIIAAVIFFLTRGNQSTLTLSVGDEKRLVVGDTFSAYVTNRGSLTVNGQAPDTSDFTSLVQIETDGSELLGLKKDGTLVYTDTLPNEVQKWKNITSIALSDTHFVGLKDDGTVECNGNSDACKVDDWKDISKIYAGTGYTIGIDKSAKLYVSGNLSIKSTLEGLSGVKAIANSDRQLSVLYNSGKVNTYALSGSQASNTGAWSNIKMIAVGDDFVAGITDKDTVVVATSDDELTQAVSKWASIRYISATDNTLVAVNLGEQVIGAGDNTYGQYGDLSQEATPTPSASALPLLSSVQNIKMNVTATGLSITWDSVANASYYEVSVNTSPNETKIKSAKNSASIGLDKLVDGTTYTVSIVAYPKDENKYGASTATKVEYAYTAPTKKLATPTDLKCVQNGNSFTFSWSPVENATSYTIAIGMVEEETTETSITIDATGMNNGDKKTAYISAKSNNAQFTESDAANIEFTYQVNTTPLATPKITTKQVNIENGTLTITWVKDDNAASYDITIGNMSFTSSSDQLSVTADRLTTNTEYLIVITAKPKDSNTYSSSSYEEKYTYVFTPPTPTPTATPQSTPQSTQGSDQGG